MNTNTDFFKIVAVTADFIAIGGVIAAIPFALLKKNTNVFAFKISVFLSYLFRSAFIIALAVITWNIMSILLFFELITFNGEGKAWENGKEIQYLISYFLVSALGLVLLWMCGTIIWTSSFNYAKEFINLFLPKNKLILKKEAVLEIIRATYGSDQKNIDVTQTVRDLVLNNKLTVQASNSLGGDPHHGTYKKMQIDYRLGEKIYSKEISEGETITLPLD
ncbi:MAG: repeat protein [Bacteroidetes bacterium]|nr:repeat protein [Bacteroidota bacterium]